MFVCTAKEEGRKESKLSLQEYLLRPHISVHYGGGEEFLMKLFVERKESTAGGHDFSLFWLRTLYSGHKIRGFSSSLFRSYPHTKSFPS